MCYIIENIGSNVALFIVYIRAVYVLFVIFNAMHATMRFLSLL